MDKRADEYRDMGTGPEEAGVSGGGISLRSLKTFRSFRNPVYRIYYLSLVGSWVSMNMQMVTRSLLIYRITGSGAILGLMSLASAIPMLLLSLFGGAIADRVQKKYVLLYGQIGLVLVSLGIALALASGYLGPAYPGSWWILVASAVLQGTAMGVTMPSRQSIIPEIVGEDQVMNAISLNNLGMNVFRLTAPALAGFIIDAFNFAAVYYLVSAVYVIATIAVAFLPPTRTMPVSQSSALADISAGLRYVRGETTTLLILFFTLCGMICGQPFTFLLPMFTEDILNVGATGLGILMSVSGGGAVLASLAIATLPNRRRGRMMIFSGLILGLALVVFASSQWWYLSLVIVVFIGLGQTGHMTMGNTLVIYYADPDYRGRMMSFFMMGMGFASLGTFLAGVASEAVGVQRAVGGLALILILISLILLTFVPRLRKLD